MSTMAHNGEPLNVGEDPAPDGIPSRGTRPKPMSAAAAAKAAPVGVSSRGKGVRPKPMSAAAAANEDIDSPAQGPSGALASMDSAWIRGMPMVEAAPVCVKPAECLRRAANTPSWRKSACCVLDFSRTQAGTPGAWLRTSHSHSSSG